MRMLIRLALILLLAAPGTLAGQGDSLPAYREQQVMIPMRDGVQLNTRIYSPVPGRAPLPFLLTRTPYGIEGSGSALEAQGSYAELAREQYIFVYQDIRGRFGSEGQFVMNRPLHDPKDATGVDESTDTYDTIAWLLANIARITGRLACWAFRIPGGSPPWPGSTPSRAEGDLAPGADDRYLDRR